MAGSKVGKRIESERCFTARYPVAGGVFRFFVAARIKSLRWSAAIERHP